VLLDKLRSHCSINKQRSGGYDEVGAIVWLGCTKGCSEYCMSASIQVCDSTRIMRKERVNVRGIFTLRQEKRNFFITSKYDKI
jgi:hypothetical protein